MSDFGVWEQLDQLRLLTDRMGVLHEAQVKQLKIWPRVIFQSSKKSECSVDIDKKGVVFDIWQNSGKKNEEKSASEILDQHVKRLFGDSWSVKIVLHYPKKANVIYRYFAKIPEIKSGFRNGA